MLDLLIASFAVFAFMASAIITIATLFDLH